MTFIKYLKDKFNLIIFYMFIMFFIYLIVFLSRNIIAFSSSALYTITVSVILFILFLMADFIKIRDYSRQLKSLEKLKDSDAVSILPRAVTNEQKIYNEFLENLYLQHSEEILRVQEEFKENTDFLTSWVHEIKTPITAIKLAVQNDKANSENVDIVKEEIDRIEDYVQKVLYYSRLSDFSKDYIIGPADMGRVVRTSIKKHSALFITKHIQLKLENIDCSVDTDEKWIGFIIDQLISNALKYTKENGKIAVYMSENDNEVIISIKDNGVGIKKEDMPNLFKRTFTGYNGRCETSSATGLGLYLSQRLAEKLGHYLTIESEKGKGTEACVHFPKFSDYYEVAKE